MLSLSYSIIEYAMRGKINPFPSSEFALLGLLYAGPAHGYVLHKLITDPKGIGMIWGIKISNLYAQLEKLEAKGLISGILQPGEDRPARIQYHLTPDGDTAFLTWLSALVHHPRDFRQEFMLRYYFLQKYKPRAIQEVCLTQLSECKIWLKNAKEREKQLKESPDFYCVVYEFRTSQIKSMTDWLEWLLKRDSKNFMNEVKNE
jgi:PadR family transcriptional regulator AphA